MKTAESFPTDYNHWKQQIDWDRLSGMSIVIELIIGLELKLRDILKFGSWFDTYLKLYVNSHSSFIQCFVSPYLTFFFNRFEPNSFVKNHTEVFGQRMLIRIPS